MTEAVISDLQSIRLMRLLQVSSASFPTGAFNHSYGFETFVHDNAIADAAGAESMCRDWLRYSVATGDGVAAAWAHRHSAAGDVDLLRQLDDLVGAVKLTREQRDASHKTGRALMVALQKVFALQLLTCIQDDVASQRCSGHHALIYGVAGYEIGLTESEVVVSFLWSGFANLISVIARLLPLGQVETQCIIERSGPLIVQCAEISRGRTLAEMSSSMTISDVASMRHERLYTRLCMS